MIPQAIITLNLLHPSHVNPRMFAYSQVFRNFHFDRTPIAPPGMKVLAHVRPQDRLSRGPHTKDGFYLSPALQHYRFHRVWITTKQVDRVIEQLKCLPHGYILSPIPTQDQIL